ncbi:MAG TPA: VOC family protein [Bryobacteraceae bacterium]|nr:VOC family protein [Bryobacteraceae bacterium]
MVKPIPDGCSTVTPYLVVKDAAKAIDFYKRAFGAQEVMRMPGPGGHGVMHAEIKIGDSLIMVSDEFPGTNVTSPETAGTTTASLFVYFEDVDAAFQRAVGAGGKPVMPPADMFWGDRYGKLVDPFGHHWGLATHKEDVIPEEMSKRADAFFASMAAGQ